MCYGKEAGRAGADPVVPAIVSERQAVLHLPVGEHLAQLLHQARHSLPLLASFDTTLQLAVGIPSLASAWMVLRNQRYIACFIAVQAGCVAASLHVA